MSRSLTILLPCLFAIHRRSAHDRTVRVITCEQGSEPAGELLRDVARYCRAHRCKPEVEHVAGSAHEKVLERATDWQADMIVLGNSAKRLSLKRLLGETAMHVIEHADVPLFLS